jgi:parallel beta-helix repeat protein
MKQLALSSLLLVVLLSSFVLSFSMFGIAEAAVSGVYINADGSVTGTNSIQRAGDLYTFVGNFSGPLYVQKDNVVIDGSGYAVTGGSGRGVVLSGRHGVTLKNARVTLDGGYIIDVESAADCVVVGNTLVGTPQPIPGLPPGPLIGPYGINFLHSQNITVKDNTITNFFVGLSLEWSGGHTITGNTLVDGIMGVDIVDSTGCVFRNNRMINSTFSLRAYPLYDYRNDLDSSNTVDGKPIYYWLNVRNKTVPSDASYVVLVGCTNIDVANASPWGITLVSTANSTINRVSVIGGGDAGITLLDSSGISILESVVRNKAIGMDLENSSNNTIMGNDVSNTMTRGIDLGNASNNLISGNTFTNNSYALAPFQDTVSNGNILSLNTFMKNEFAVIAQGTMQILNNTFVGNDEALLCYSGSNTIFDNTFTNNKQGVIIQSTNNVFRNNHFTNNLDSLPINGANFINDIDSSNTMNGKPIYYWVKQRDRTVPSDASFVALVNCSGIVVRNLTLKNQNQGILLAFTSNSTVSGNVIANNTNGVYLYGSSSNRFIGNNFTANGYAVYIGGATMVFFGVYSSYTPSSGNVFHHNNFIDNNQTLSDMAGTYSLNSPSSTNIWDDGREGNYWSTYTGVDANGDGIGDSFYVLYANNTDRYPLMKQQAGAAVPEFSVLVFFLVFAAVTTATVLGTKRRLFHAKRGTLP